MLRPALIVAALALAAGCGGGDEPSAPAQASRPSAAPDAPRECATVRRARCDPAADNCAAVTGRVVLVGAVDPYGDGDAHYVLAGGDVTAPGLSAIDVRRDLRPRRLPRPGDLVSAAGPVFTWVFRPASDGKTCKTALGARPLTAMLLMVRFASPSSLWGLLTFRPLVGTMGGTTVGERG